MSGDRFFKPETVKQSNCASVVLEGNNSLTCVCGEKIWVSSFVGFGGRTKKNIHTFVH